MANVTSGIANFFADLVSRFFKPTPKFFNILKVVGVLAAGITQLMSFAQELGINIDPVAQPYKTIITVSGIVVAFVAQLAVPNANEDPTLKVK